MLILSDNLSVSTHFAETELVKLLEKLQNDKVAHQTFGKPGSNPSNQKKKKKE